MQRSRIGRARVQLIRLAWLGALSLAGPLARGEGGPIDFPPPKSPGDALATIQARPGFQVELVAAEPLVMDPIAFDWGPDGKLWVVEMADYPSGLDGHGSPGGRIRFLEDTDADGRYDKSTLLLEGVAFPNGVFAWREGVLVSAAPEIFFAADTDLDGTCDVRKTLYRGFSENNPQHRMNGFAWGLDNWLYCGGDHQQVEVTSLGTGASVALGKHDFRIRPDQGLLEPITGQTQFGRTRDDWGNWFGSSNSEPAFHFALDDRYLRRNPFLRPRHAVVQISKVPGAAPVYPTSQTLARFNDQNKVNRFTSACGLTIYRDLLFGPEYYGNTFVCEPVHNLVHREIMSPAEYTFSSHRAGDETELEFLTSSDNWFRPSSARTGPDGALWIADMYRQVIEHPEWIPDEWEARLDVRAGHDKGRIYRVYPIDVSPRKIPRTVGMSSGQLVELLGSPNGTQRDMAQQMLVWRKDVAAAASLSELVAAHPLATTRLQALCTLDGMGAVDDRVLALALHDDHPGVRRHAIRLSEPRLSSAPQLAQAVLSRVGDTDSQVELQLAYTLGAWQGEPSARALSTLLLRAAPGSHLHIAAMSSLLPHLDLVARTVLDQRPAPPAEMVAELLADAVAAGRDATVSFMISAISQASLDTHGASAMTWRVTAISGLLTGLDARRLSLAEYRAGGAIELRDALALVDNLFASARRIASDDTASTSDRLAALALLGQLALPVDVKRIAPLLTVQTPFTLQLAAVSALARFSDTRVPRLLLAGWSSHAPHLRREIISVLFSRGTWQQQLLAAVETSIVSIADLDATRRQQLLEHKDPAVRQRAGKLFGAAPDVNREQLLSRYQAVNTLAGSVDRGFAAYQKSCANCHRLGDVGYAVGPDLMALTDKSPAAMLVAILDPNRAVESKYVSFTAADADGRIQSGLLISEAGDSVELLAAEGKRYVFPRSQLEALQSSGKSLMPEGFEKELSARDVADLIAFLASHSEVRKDVFGNLPKVVEAESLRREFWLLPTDCELYGSTLTLEPRHGNVGQWRSENDRAVWTIRVDRGGTYRLSLEYACAPDTAGNQCAVEVDAQQVIAEIQSTGSWDVYREFAVGRVTLLPGEHRLSVRAAQLRPGSELADLKSVRLLPASR